VAAAVWIPKETNFCTAGVNEAAQEGVDQPWMDHCEGNPFSTARLTLFSLADFGPPGVEGYRALTVDDLVLLPFLLLRILRG
jgi:hypothetical protein